MSILDNIKEMFEAKQSSGQGLMVVEGSAAVWAPRDYETFSKDGYQSNPYVFAAISEIARSVSGLPWVVIEKNRDGSQSQVSDPNNPVLKLINRPNPDQSSATFIEAAISFYLIAGNVYIEAVGPENGAPKEIWLLRPDRMSVIPGREGIIGYEYKVKQKKIRIAFEDCLHLKSFNPISDYYGMSPLEAAARSVDQNNESRFWNYNLLKNNAKVTFALTTDGELTDQQRQRIKKEFEDKYSGPTNAAKPKVFEGGIKPHIISQSPEQMDWSEGIRLSGKEIAIALGVPPEVIGDSQNRSYASYSEARKSFYMETVLPIAEIYEQEINNWLMPKLDDRYRLMVDKDRVDALQEDRSEIWTRTMSAVSAGVITTNEARDLLGFESIEGMDTLVSWDDPVAIDEAPKALLLPSNTKTVRRCTPGEKDPDKPGADQVWCVLTEDESRVLGRHATRAEAERQLAVIDGPKAEVQSIMTNEQKLNAWKGVDQQREAAVEATKGIFEKRLNQEIKEICKALNYATAEQELIIALEIAAEQQKDQWNKTLQEVYLGVGEGFAVSVFDNLKNQPGPTELKIDESVLSTWSRFIIEYLEEAFGKKFLDLSHTTQDVIWKKVTEYLEGGMSWKDVANEIEATMPGGHEVKIRAERIARTETLTAASASSHFAAKATGLTLVKTWIGTPDFRARKWHQAGIQSAEMDVAYVVKRPGKNPARGQFNGYDRLMFPGDWTFDASPGNIINCRCVEVYKRMDAGE